MRGGPKRISNVLLVLLALTNPSTAESTLKTESRTSVNALRAFAPMSVDGQFLDVVQ
jgi:hypothetical protein